VDEKYINSLLRNKVENDRIEFKNRWNIFDSRGKVVDIERNEMIKDILGLANGNGTNIKDNKYLIIGVENDRFDENGMRVIHNVDYKVPSQSEITKWVNDASNPSVVGIKSEYVSIEGKKIFVVTIPPTFDLHELTRDLSAKGKFKRFTVFMRQDEHTVPASVRDGVTIQELKHLYRREIINPTAILSCSIVGAISSMMFYFAGNNAKLIISDNNKTFVSLFIGLIGGLLGAEAGWIFREWNSLRFTWPFWPWRKKVLFVIFVILTIAFFSGYIYIIFIKRAN